MLTTTALLRTVRQGDWWTSLDLKDAYYSVPIQDCTKYFTFQLNDIHYKLVLPNGYKKWPLKFTKLTKAPMANLRIKGHLVAIYIDDIFIVGLTFQEFVDAVRDVHVHCVPLVVSLKKTDNPPRRRLQGSHCPNA